MIPENFWLQPPIGFDEKTKGLSVEVIKKKEKELGVSFPNTYKQLMQLQNGGNIRRCSFIDDGEEIGGFLKIDFSIYRINTFMDYLKLTKNEDELKEMYNQFDFCYPERLITFADFHGHGGIFFDYGWLQEKSLIKPSVRIIVDDGNEFLHYQQTKCFESFEKFIESLEEIQGEPINILVSSELDFETFINIVQQKWKSTFKEVEKNWGWAKHFSSSYDGIVPLFIDDKTVEEYIKTSNSDKKEMKGWIEKEGRNRKIKSSFSPNQFLSGTYQFQDNAEYNIVIDIYRPWFPVKHVIKNFIEELDNNSELKIKNRTIANNV